MKKLFRVMVMTGADDDRVGMEVFVETSDGINAAVAIADRFVAQEDIVGYDREVVDVSKVFDGPVIRLEDVAGGH